MLLSTLSGGLSHVYVSSLMVSCTHLVSTSLVSIVFPVYIMSIAYWRAQASSADHWHHLSRWCSQVIYGTWLVSGARGVNWVSLTLWLFCLLCTLLSYCVWCVYQWYVRLRAYGLLATCRELLGSFWGLSLEKLLGSLLGDFSGKLPGERSGYI